MKKYIVYIAFSLLTAPFLQAKITIYTIGDSTMANRSSGDVEQGWGGTWFSYFIDKDKVQTSNHAINGYSTKSFIDSGKWTAVYNSLKEGDYVFIQFGHNDAKTDASLHTDPETTYRTNLKKFINETKSKGAIPVLMTSIVRRSFDNLGMISSTHGGYPDAVRAAAKETGAFMIDMEQKTAMMENIAGIIGSRDFHDFRPGTEIDNTHLSRYGAYVAARLAADGIREQNIPIPLNNKPAAFAKAKTSTMELAYSLLSDNLTQFNELTASMPGSIDKSEYVRKADKIQEDINNKAYTTLGEADAAARELRLAALKLQWQQPVLPFDASFAVGNPSMEEGVIWDISNNSTMPMSWTLDARFSGGKDIALKTGNTSHGSYRFYIGADAGFSLNFYQDIQLPAGAYVIRADLKPYAAGIAFLYAGIDGEVKKTEARGSWSSWGTTELRFAVQEEKTVRIGVNSSQSVMIDNFKLIKTVNPASAPAVQQQAVKIKAVKGGILIPGTDDHGRPVNIYSLTGQILKTVNLTPADLFVALNKGVYIIDRKKMIIE